MVVALQSNSDLLLCQASLSRVSVGRTTAPCADMRMVGDSLTTGLLVAFPRGVETYLLLDDLRNDTSADGSTAFANRES
jgi:hypothetical protein